MREFAFFFALQATNYLTHAINSRAMNNLQYASAAVSDLAICLLGWTILRRVPQASGWKACAGYACGGPCGVLLGMWLTRMWG